MLSVPNLNLGSVDAINYKTRDEKDFFSKIIYKEEYLNQILKRKKYFVIGEKGTGKTSYAVFLNNSDYNETLSRIVSLNQTDYLRFISMMGSGKFDVNSYVEIWKVILLLLVSDNIGKSFPNAAGQFPIFRNLRDAIEEYYDKTFQPQVYKGLEMIENASTAVSVMRRHDDDAASDVMRDAASGIAADLPYLERRFKAAISSLKLDRDFILFMDGIDIRPDQIEYARYIECIRGLANAAWELNTEYFSNIRDTRKHIKICLLMRPDILDNMGFQNLNAKVRDNGVVLNWLTTYDGFKNSPLFNLVAGTLAKQQPEKNENIYAVWKHYFPYELDNLRLAEVVDDPFVGFLRYSFYRPRDIIQYLQLMQENVTAESDSKEFFTEENFKRCERDFSEYLLGEVKDYLAFYYSTADFDEIVGFFSQIGGKNRFGWVEFQKAFERYKVTLQNREVTIRELSDTPEAFLQFLYSLNIIGYLEPDQFGGNFVHYCFRDRSTVKLRPKVRFGPQLSFQVHPGLQRALLVGGQNRTRHKRKPRKRSTKPTSKIKSAS